MQTNSHLLDKAVENNKVSAQLLTQGSYATSVHAAYYSCVQTMLHYLKHELGMSENQLKVGTNKAGGTHLFLQNIFESIIKQKFGDLLVDEFHKSIAKLKDLRNTADYKDIQITNEDAINAINFKQNILTILNNL